MGSVQVNYEDQLKLFFETFFRSHINLFEKQIANKFNRTRISISFLIFSLQLATRVFLLSFSLSESSGKEKELHFLSCGNFKSAQTSLHILNIVYSFFRANCQLPSSNSHYCLFHCLHTFKRTVELSETTSDLLFLHLLEKGCHFHRVITNKTAADYLWLQRYPDNKVLHNMQFFSNNVTPIIIFTGKK